MELRVKSVTTYPSKYFKHYDEYYNKYAYRRPEEGAVHLPGETREDIPEEVVFVLNLKASVENVWVRTSLGRTPQRSKRNVGRLTRVNFRKEFYLTRKLSCFIFSYPVVV